MDVYYILKSHSHEEEKEKKEREEISDEGHHKENHHKDDHHKNETVIAKVVPLEFWDDPDYHKYLNKHGVHFCDTLAIWASEKLKNKHGDSKHLWSVEEVKAAYNNLGLLKPENVTWGDATYSANNTYANFFGETLRTEIDVLKHSNADLFDTNNYSGKTFNRWLSDVMGLKVNVPWSSFVY